MLVDEDDSDILPLFREPLEGRLDGRILGLVVDDEEVLLCFGAGRDVLSITIQR